MSPYRPRSVPLLLDHEHDQQTRLPKHIRSSSFGAFTYVAVSDNIPGFKTSAAFFVSLKSNLDLQDSYYYPSSTPSSFLLHAHLYHNEGYRQQNNRNEYNNSLTSFTFPTRQHNHPRSWSSSSSSSSSTSCLSPAISDDYAYDSEDEIIPSVTPIPQVHLARTTSERQQALHLLATSITQQGSTASYILLTHSSSLLLLFLILMITLRWTWTSTQEIRKPISASLAILLGGLVIAKLFGRKYAHRGRVVETDGWVAPRDEIVVATITRGALQEGNTDVHSLEPANVIPDDADDTNTMVIGVLILRYHPHEGKLSKKGKRVGRGWIRGWAVNPTHHKQGIGTSLLSYATKLVASRGGDGVWFAADHAHSHHPLPPFYTSPFRLRDERARLKLDAVMKMSRGGGNLGGRRRSW